MTNEQELRELVEVFRAGFLKEHSEIWDMETTSTAAHTAASIALTLIQSREREAVRAFSERIVEEGFRCSLSSNPADYAKWVAELPVLVASLTGEKE